MTKTENPGGTYQVQSLREQRKPIAKDRDSYLLEVDTFSEVHVYWDLENCSIPTNVNVVTACQKIREYVNYIQDGLPSIPIWVYGNKNCFSRMSAREIIDSEIVDIQTTNDVKDSADKRMIVDIMTMAIDCPGKAICLISSDVDFAYCLDKLRIRGHNILLIHGRNTRETFVSVANHSVDWYKLVRGLLKYNAGVVIADETEQEKITVEMVESALESIDKAFYTIIYEQNLIINVSNVRAASGLMGRLKERLWQAVSSTDEYKEMLDQATNEQRMLSESGLKHFDPTQATWDDFTVKELKYLYDTLLRLSGVKKHGKFPLSMVIHRSVNEHGVTEPIPLAKILCFTELSLRVNWIQETGQAMMIQTYLLNELPYHMITADMRALEESKKPKNSTSFSPQVNYNIDKSDVDKKLSDFKEVQPLKVPTMKFSSSTINSPTPRVTQTLPTPIVSVQNTPMAYKLSNANDNGRKMNAYVSGRPVRTVSECNAKSALQFYFQKLFRCLPTYDCVKSGAEHIPIFEVNIQVKLPQGQFTDQYFFAMGKSSNKKQAEKLAAQNGCNTLLLRYLPEFDFPSNFLDPI